MQLLKRLAVSGLTALWLVHGALIADEQQGEQPSPEPDLQPAQEPEQQSIAPATDEKQETGDPQEISAQSLFPPDQIEQLVAPIALYPDALLAQMLMAATYPTDIVQAARWIRDNEKLEGEALEKAAEEQPWDPSVKTLVFFPSVLAYMNENLAWTQDLGDAMVAQQDEIMDAVQSLRNQAQDAGTLQTNEQQRVEAEGDTIVVQPANPEVVYVPTYDPSTVYGQTAPPATTYYPSTYAVPITTTTSSSTDSWITFGAGALAGGLLTAAILWNRNDYGIYRGGRGYYGRPGYWGNSNYWKGGWKRSTNINRNINASRGDVNINRQVNKWQPSRTNVGRARPNPGGNRPNGRRPDTGRKASGGRPGAGVKPPGGRERPQTGPAKRQATRPGAPAPKPGAKPGKRPAGKPGQKPAAKPARKPAAKPAKRPAAKSARKPAAKPAKRPAAKPARAKGGKSSAFNVNKGNATRAASKRGAASRGGARTAKRGGGAHRGGGSRAHRGGGGRRR